MLHTQFQADISTDGCVFDCIYLQAGSSSEEILKSMSQELVPAGPLALKQEKEQITLDGYVSHLHRMHRSSLSGVSER